MCERVEAARILKCKMNSEAESEVEGMCEDGCADEYEASDVRMML